MRDNHRLNHPIMKQRNGNNPKSNPVLVITLRTISLPIWRKKSMRFLFVFLFLMKQVFPEI
jgi:hypothetical protein